MSKRAPMPPISTLGCEAVDRFAAWLRVHALHPVTIRNYVSDLRHFVAWYDARLAADPYDGDAKREDLVANDAAPVDTFAPEHVTSSQLAAYRMYLHATLRLRPASINRALISLKRYFAFAAEEGILQSDPSKPVRLVKVADILPRFLSDREVDALVAAVTKHGSLRDRAMVLLLLHTGLRASEAGRLQARDVHLDARSGKLDVIDKNGKKRSIPLNVTARRALADYLPSLQPGSALLFPSTKTWKALSARGLGYVVKRYAALAGVPNMSTHDLRHRFGYRMVATFPLHHVAWLMGHESLETTLVYARGRMPDHHRPGATSGLS